MKYLVVNLKMNMDVFEINKYINNITYINKDRVNLVIAPSFPFIPYFVNKNVLLASQDVSKYIDNKYTGEVSVEQIKSLGVSYCIIGHFERRKYFGENIGDIITKINNCINYNLTPIYCINEFDTVNELKNVMGNIKELNKIIFCYEPSYLIGGESIEELEKIKYNVNVVRKVIGNNKLLYGGSVNTKNISLLEKTNLFDGYMVSTSGLDISNLKGMVDELNG